MTDFTALPQADEPDATSTDPGRPCVDCGYDLRGLQQNRCPECGLEFDPLYLPPADIPWLKSDGSIVRAYFKTVWLVLVRPGRFGETVWQEVEVDGVAATRFRWTTIGVACGSVLATLLPAFAPLSKQGVIVLAALCAPVIMFLWMATEKFNIIQFRPPRYLQEVRFHRLHDLSCAGLALAPIVPLFVFLGIFLGWSAQYIALRAFGLTCLVIVAWWYGSLRYQIHGGRCGLGDAILHALLQPFVWSLIAVVVLVFSFGIAGLVAPLVR